MGVKLGFYDERLRAFSARFFFEKTDLLTRKSGLTEVELRIPSKGVLDLAAGYPSMPPPIWIDSIVRSGGVHAGREEARGSVTQLRAIDSELGVGVCSVLGIAPSFADSFCVLPSGSIAINRVVSVMASRGGRIVVSSPTFDVIAATISEFSNCEMCVVEALSFCRFDVEAIIEAIDSNCAGVALCSPENPTGVVLTKEDIFFITQRAAQFGVPVFVDQCFCLFGSSAEKVPLLTNCAHPDSDWIMLWDTGKTIGLCQEKAAFLFSSESIFTSLRDRVRVVCFDISWRTKKLFVELLGDQRMGTHIRDLNSQIDTNRTVLKSFFDGVGGRCHAPATTSLALVSYSDDGVPPPLNSVSCCAPIEMHVVPLRVFLLSDALNISDPISWYRVALARDVADFRVAVSRFTSTVQ